MFYSELTANNRRQNERMPSGINRALSVALQAIADDPSLEVNVRFRDRRPPPQRSPTPPRRNRRRSRSGGSAARVTRGPNPRSSGSNSRGRDSDGDTIPPLESSAQDSSDADIPDPPNYVLSYRNIPMGHATRPSES